MTTPTTSRIARAVQDRHRKADGSDWRCTCCAKLLGRRHGTVVLIQFARGHCYRAPRPVSAVCRGCGTLNET